MQTLVDTGEVYFRLTDDMFDALYPGQFDRRIDGLRIRFPGLAEAGISPHGRLQQISNTRYLTRARGNGARRLTDRHALQSILIGAPEIDTATHGCPQGMLKRFQNTGVSSLWHLSIPSLVELHSPGRSNRRNAQWRAAAQRHCGPLQEHLDDVIFEVAFTGRW